jgi:glycosyltransferase involved in cell wall biosynthesis
VADFRDPWASGNPYKRSLSTPLSRKAKKLERLICNAAARVVTNTEELRAQFLGNYPDYTHKIVTITNGFDSGAYEPFVKFYQDSTYARTFDPDKDVLELCHFGTVYGNRNPLALFQAMKELLQENRMQQGQLRVRLVGTWEVRDDRCEALARELETQGFLQREPQVPYELCLQRMTSAPILLILQPASPLQVPAKIYEYIATGRPLLVIGGEGATARLVEQYQLGRCCPNHVPAIKTLLWHLITGQTRIEPPQTVSRAHFDYYTLTGELAHLLDSVCAEKQRALQ